MKAGGPGASVRPGNERDETDEQSGDDVPLSSTDDERENRSGKPGVSEGVVAQKAPQLPSKEEIDKHKYCI